VVLRAPSKRAHASHGQGTTAIANGPKRSASTIRTGRWRMARREAHPKRGSQRSPRIHRAAPVVPPVESDIKQGGTGPPHPAISKPRTGACRPWAPANGGHPPRPAPRRGINKVQEPRTPPLRKWARVKPAEVQVVNRHPGQPFDQDHRQRKPAPCGRITGTTTWVATSSATLSARGSQTAPTRPRWEHRAPATATGSPAMRWPLLKKSRR